MAVFGFTLTGDKKRTNAEWVAALESKVPTPVRDFPRPPACIALNWPVRVELEGEIVAECERVVAVLETTHPPTYYLPPDAFKEGTLSPASASGGSYCEWKGRAQYFDLSTTATSATTSAITTATTTTTPVVRRQRVVWSYPNPIDDRFSPLAGWYALYPSQVSAVYLKGERVRPQQGGFYGGWITSDVEGPFKGDPAHPELI